MSEKKTEDWARRFSRRSEKVFCEECGWLDEAVKHFSVYGLTRKYTCTNPDRMEEDTWFAAGGRFLDCEQRNAHNDCSGFKQAIADYEGKEE